MLVAKHPCLLGVNQINLNKVIYNSVYCSYETPLIQLQPVVENTCTV